MKLRMCVFFLLVSGCSPSDPFVKFSALPQDSDAAPPDACEVDSGSDSDGAADADGAPGAEDAAPLKGSGGASTGGASTGGASTGGGTGGLQGNGGTPEAGGALGTGGAVDACVLVTHTSGISLTWQDCAPLGTYDENQAMKACKASGAPECVASNCGVGNRIVCGYNNETQNYLYGCWGYQGELTGYARERNEPSLCSGFNWTWG